VRGSGELTRRESLGLSAAAALWSIATQSGCVARRPCPRAAAAPPEPPALDAEARELLSSGTGALPIVVRGSGPAAAVLRRRATAFAPPDLDLLPALERRMRASLAATGRGVGLAAPQVGIRARAILVMLDARGDAPHVELFVNPVIVDRSDELALGYEGCLSIPAVCGMVLRSRRIVVEHGLEGGRRVVEPTGFEARIFQHEIDHLDGVLYVDRLIGDLEPIERLPELREQLEREHPELASTSRPSGRRSLDAML